MRLSKLGQTDCNILRGLVSVSFQRLPKIIIILLPGVKHGHRKFLLAILVISIRIAV